MFEAYSYVFPPADFINHIKNDRLVLTLEMSFLESKFAVWWKLYFWKLSHLSRNKTQHSPADCRLQTITVAVTVNFILFVMLLVLLKSKIG